MARFTTSCGAIENVTEALPTQNAMVEQYKVSYTYTLSMHDCNIASDTNGGSAVLCTESK